MKLKVSELVLATGGSLINASSASEEVIDWCSLIETKSISPPADVQTVAFFSLVVPNQGGWTASTLDRRSRVSDLFSRFPRWLFVVDNQQEDLPLLITSGCRLCVVENVYSAALTLHQYVLGVVRPTVIGVTGSVGKTTCVALLEDVLSIYGRTLRIFSKRLSPLTVAAACINFLDRTHRYIVMEYSLYRRSHVRELCAVLKPNVGVMLDISGAHLGIDGMTTTEDLFISKAELLRASHHSIVSESIAFCLDEFKNVTRFGFSARNIHARCVPERSEIWIHNQKLTVRPFLLTTLSFQQAMAALLVVTSQGLTFTQSTLDTITKFRPKENRLTELYVGNTKVIFDGEPTYMARISALADHYYDDAALMILHADHGEQPLEPQIPTLTASKVLETFVARYVGASIEKSWLERLTSALQPELIEFRHIDSCIGRHNVVFLHIGGWWRFNSELPTFLSKYQRRE